MMEKTKKEDGRLNEEAEAKDEGQETQLDEDAKEVLESLKRKQRLLKWLERTWIVVVVCIALTIVGWMACGRWLQAFNNALWLFIAWMYWKQREAFSNAADYTVYMTEMLADSNEMVECYEKKDGIGKIEIISIASCMIIGCIVLWFFLSKDDLVNGLTTYLCSALLLLLYGAMIYLSNYTGKRILKVLILAVAMIECLSNTLAVGINSTVSRTDYVKDEVITEKTS